VVKSFSMGDIHIDWPYYDCYITKNGRIDVWIEGHGDDTKFLKIDDQFDCTFDQENSAELATEDLEELLDDFDRGGVGVADATQLDVDVDFIDELDSTRIDLDAPVDEGKYLLRIPKCAVESFAQAVDDGAITVSCLDELKIVVDDPLVVWRFENDDCTITIEKLIDESCKRGFIGSGFKDDDANDNVVGDNLQAGYDNGGNLVNGAGDSIDPEDVDADAEDKLSATDRAALNVLDAEIHFIDKIPLDSMQLEAIIKSDNLNPFIKENILSAQIANTELDQGILLMVIKDGDLNDGQIETIVIENTLKSMVLSDSVVIELGRQDIANVNVNKIKSAVSSIIPANEFEALLKQGRDDD